MPKSKKQTAEEIENRLTTPVPRLSPIPDADWLSSGLTNLNLAASGHLDRLIPKGKYLYVVGDSDSGKTHATFQLLAEAARNKHFDKHRFIHDNAERGALMDVAKFFGQSVADRLEPPRGTKSAPEYSSTVQEFFYNIDNALDHKRPCVYLLDSVDAIGADQDDEHFQKSKKAFENGKDAPGSYGMSKPKYISQHINRISQRLATTGSIGVFISQTRDAVGGYAGQKTRSGGRALKFYARLELWFSVDSPIKRTILGQERKYGDLLEIEIKKNHLTGWKGKVTPFPFYPSHGFDEVEAMVRFLIDEGVWNEKDVQIGDQRFEGAKKEQLVRSIEAGGLEQSVRELVVERWRHIQEESAVQRKPRY